MERFEGEVGLYELLQPEPVILGRLCVFLAARAVRTGEEVLIKAFRDSTDPGAVGSLRREISALRKLRHPNILEIIDYNLGGTPESTPFLVLPWCRGGNLDELRRRSDFLPLSAAIGMLRQIAGAIDFAHANGVVHGDVKPQNVLLSGDKQTAFLCDFGIAKYFDVTDRVRNTGETQDGSRSSPGGTSAYLSPEQLTDNEQTVRSDIYSFGLVAFELLTGRLPFDVRLPLYKQLHARVIGELDDAKTVNPMVSEAERLALAQALAVDAKSRPASATAFCDMLVGVGVDASTMSGQTARKWKSWTDLEPAGRAGVITALVTAIAGIVVALVAIIPKLLGIK